MKQVFFCLILIGMAVSNAYSQRPNYTGLVNDKQSGEPLPGATVTITGAKGLHIVSGLNGAFAIRTLPAGDYTIRVNFVGYADYETRFTVGDGKAPNLHIELERKKNELTGVSVSARREGNTDKGSQLIDRKADAVQNSVSARAIEISPDLSVANVTQRISGVSVERSTNGEGQYVIVRGMDKRYNYTLVNGVKIPSPDNKNRYVPLDIFPADLLERLEVSKSLTPDKEGDAIGGAVNMIMKDAPDKLSLRGNLALGYADKFFTQDYKRFSSSQSLSTSPRIANGPKYQATMNDFPNSAFSYSTRSNPVSTVAGLSLGNRFFNKKLGVLLAGSFQNTYRNVDAVVFGTEAGGSASGATVTSIESRHYSIQQQRSGLHARLDYLLDANNKINLYAGYMNLVKNEFRFSTDTSLQLGRVGSGSGRINNQYRTVHDVQTISNINLNGEHTIAGHFTVNWIASWSRAIGNRPDQAELDLNTGVTKDAGGNLVQGPLYLDPNSDRKFTHSSDEDKSGYLKLTYRSILGSVKADWSIGGMYRDKNRVSQYDDYQLRPTPGIQTYNGDVNNNTFTVFNGEGTLTNSLNYTAEEKVGAAYGMLRLQWDRLEAVGGARYENTDLTWLSNLPETSDGKTGSITYYDVLPSALLKYTFNKKSILRASYYSAISRPNFYEVVPHISHDADADYDEMGNPQLKHTTADNYDIRYEYFPRGLDQLLAGVFYKRIKNPIEYALELQGTNLYYKPDNFGTANNYGFELDAVKFFRWFGIKANYTFTNSEINTPKRKPGFVTDSTTIMQTRPLQGQSKHIANLSLLVKDDNKIGLNAQLAFTYVSRRINTVSQFLDNDIWQKGFAQMDFSAEKRLSPHWYIYVKLNNLLNTPYTLEIKQPYTGAGIQGDVPYQKIGKNEFVRRDTYGANYLLGVKFKL